jgi:hypothetical protein
MKKLLTLILLLFTLKVFSQTTDTLKTTEAKFVYCELVGFSKLFSTKVTISIDYGEERSFFQDTRLRDEITGKLQSFNSMVDGLNYMGKNGWEFVQAYTVGQSPNFVYHWLLKKKK